VQVQQHPVPHKHILWGPKEHFLKQEIPFLLKPLPHNNKSYGAGIQAHNE